MTDPQREDKKRRDPSSSDPNAGAGRQGFSTSREEHHDDATRDQDALNIPTVELPKGGGALKSIDEKFQVNAANGTVSFSVPLPFSKTRSDFAPALSLGYNSGSGNGVFGLGWSLTHAIIQRRTDKHLPEYEDTSESDVFVLSAAEDMVPVLVQDSAGDLTVDAFVAPTGESVKRYRPRIEGPFARIERVTPPGATSFFWKITSKDNVVTVYGRSASARVAHPSAPGLVYKWLPELSYDDKGNCLEYSYVPEDFQNVPDTLHERNRLNGLAPCTNTYLKSVKYGNRHPYYPNPLHPFSPQTPADPAYFFELVFDYGDHDPDAPEPVTQRPWPCRLDPFSEYKPGFEVRTYRLCRRALLFHYFKELNDGINPAPCLVRSLDLDYRYFANLTATPSELRNIEVDYLAAIRQTGWVKSGPASYFKRSLPAVQLTYQELSWNRTVQAVSAENLENAPTGLSHGYQFVDLWGEGISGIFTEQADAWLYKSNLGDGRFTPAQAVAPKPSFTGLATGSLQLQDLEADGRKFMVVTQPPLRGAFELSDGGEWQPFVSFQRVPNVALNDPDARFIDLDGDGRPDLAVSEESVFTWYQSTGISGYEGPRVAPKPFDEEKGPALVFSDPTGSIFLASMSGSGLTDIVRIRNGEVCYWPNLGYGRFGAKVSMDFCPVFDTPDLFNPDYIHLADVSGTGAADILYLGKNRFRVWLNQSGNAWSEETSIDPFPTTELPNQLSVADFLGNGTACIVWSSPLPRYATHPMQYIDLMGGKKPYLLSGYSNQSGKEVALEFKSSTFFYLADKRAGKPWITKLPFPVHCLTKVSSRDTVTRASLVTEYVYHHGYYDHAEREYRGFGCVEQTDTETFDEFVRNSGSSIVNQPLDQAPVLTTTWFHTGAFFGEDDILARLRAEYFQNAGFAEYHLPSPQVPASLSAQEMREAQRACKGMMIRQEVYGLDGIDEISTVPYSASERNCLIQRVQPLDVNRYAVFLVTESETITYAYERDAKDPRISHSLNTAIDEFGNILEAASVTYPRQPGVLGLPIRVQTEQQKLQITYAVTGYTNDCTTSAAYRLRLRCETTSFELTGLAPAATYFTMHEIQSAFAGASPIKYEDAPDGSSQKRALKHSRTLFLKDDLSGPLVLGQMQSLGLTYETYRLTFTPTLLAALYGTRVTPAFLTEGAYIRSDDFKAAGIFPLSDQSGERWRHAGRAQYPAAAANVFYMPDGFLDPFGNATSVAYYADYQLLVQAVTDAIGNATSVETFDFRSLLPQLIKDTNGNLSEIRVDALGYVAGTALKGKGTEADDFAAFVTELTPADIANFFGDPVTHGPILLQHATSRFVYDFSVIPVRVASIVRETHFKDSAAAGVPSKLQYRFEYSDGFGNVAMRKLQAEPGIALALDSANNLIEVDTTPNLRWIGDGRTALNNKGKPVKQFEPYFSATYNYEDDPQLVEIGVTPLLYYDPPGRNVRTEYPNGTFSKVDIHGWMTQTFDQNDTVTDSDWYTQRTTGSLAGNAQENQAAQKAAVHYNTPVTTHSDTLGRAFYTVSHNRFVDHTTLALTDLFYETCTHLDIEGNTKQLIDPRGNSVVSYDYDMLSRQDHSRSMDAGERWVLNDCIGNPLYNFDSKSQAFHTLYDAIRRPVKATVAKGAAAPIVFDQITYGEGQPGDETQNIRGRVFEHRDQAGIQTNQRFDFKGNLLESTRVLTTVYQDDIDWSKPQSLQQEIFTTQSQYDALDRPIRIVAPNSNPASANVLVPTYNAAGMLETVVVNVRGATPATPFVTNIDYNEKRQRTRIDYANGASTVYKYDPLTFRLIGLVTVRNADPELFWADRNKIDQPAFAGDVLQFLTYTFDPVGNITYIRDDAQQTIYFDNQRVEPSCDYTYDAVYWLVQSRGREHSDSGQTPGPSDDPRMGNSQPYNGSQLQTYTQRYDYDPAGNVLLMKNLGSWSMAFTYGAANNQLLNAVPGGSIGAPFTYPYDAHGNVSSMPHLTTIDWDFRDRLRHTAVSASGSVSQESWYVYDSSGQRVRKIVQKGNFTEERVYLGAVEIFRRSTGGAVTLERETMHVNDETRRIAMIDTPTVIPAGSKETQLVRYQYSNHLGTSCLELDDKARIISYEEYYAFGSTSYQGMDQTREVPAKRYRYTGKERDEETGFCYHGARYYAPWLLRWTAADPIGAKDGPNAYRYCHNNPIRLQDADGTQGGEPDKKESHSEVTVTYDRPAEPGAESSEPDHEGIPPLQREIGSPSTVFGNQTQSLGQGLQLNDPQALGGALSYYRGMPYSSRTFFPHLDLEYNMIGAGVGGKGAPAASLPAGSFTAQLSARIAPIPRVPNLTLGAVVNVGPSGASGASTTTSAAQGITAQYGARLVEHVGVGVFGQAMVNESSSGPSTYSGTLTPILQWQPNEKTQLVLNPTISGGSGGSFVNQNPYGSFVTAGGLAGGQFGGHWIAEAGYTRTWADSLTPGGATGEHRVIGGVGYTASVGGEDGNPVTMSAVVNPFVGIPSGATRTNADPIAAGAMLTLTVAFRIPLYRPQPSSPTDR
ncbi:RHS repeat-associated core domain-containing protein [Burkholderia sp. YR290]|nr:RHS repeat-associated core domain-containing protein [Burkholderia sp. YR290]